MFIAMQSKQSRQASLAIEDGGSIGDCFKSVNCRRMGLACQPPVSLFLFFLQQSFPASERESNSVDGEGEDKSTGGGPQGRHGRLHPDGLTAQSDG